MKFKLAVVAAAALAITPLAQAAGQGNPKTKEMMQQAGCFACHAVDHKVVGPAYAWVAARYKDNKKTVKTLAEKVLKGGSGHWNKWTSGVPMSPNPSLGLKKAEEAVHWILAQKPVKAPKP